MMEFVQYLPTRLMFGLNTVELVGDVALKFGKRVCLLTPTINPGIEKNVNRVKSILEQSCVELMVLSETMPNPLVSKVNDIVLKAVDFKPDVIVACGGGSTIDTAKVVAYCVGMHIKDVNLLFDDEDKIMTIERFNVNSLPFIAIPTTSGTGSQVTQAAVITDLSGVKRTLFKQEFYPTVAIIDASLCESLPAYLTATTGFDAFCHIAESYLNHHLSFMLDHIALEGIKLIGNSLQGVVEKPSIQGRLDMCMADTIGGICLSNGGANVPHMIAEMITSAIPRINHGAALAIVFPYFVEEYYESELKGRLVEVLSCLSRKNISSKEDAFKVMEEFEKSIGLSVDIHSYQVTENELDRFVELVHNEGRYDQRKVERILQRIVKGE